jgi:endonuclease/exonuclease/phosphatase family metal-dependent hydrolase
MKKWIYRAVAVAAIAYPVVLLATAVMFRWIGERWWVTSGALYLPRALFAAPLPVIVIALLVCRYRRLLVTQAIAGLVILFPLMGLVIPTPHFARAAKPKIRVLSYNINSGYGGADHLDEQIARFDPDIVFLQEIGWDVKALNERLRARYAEVQTSTQFLIASRFPIRSTREPDKLPFNGDARSPRFIVHAIDTPLGAITFYNVHPISPRQGFYHLRGAGLRREILSGRLFSGERADWMQGSAELRELQVRAFSEFASQESQPVVIAGDTNLPGLSATFGRYLSRFRDGFRDAGSGFGYTFDTGRTPWMRLDRILASDQLEFVRFEVGDSLASDHLCVVADLQRSTP